MCESLPEFVQLINRQVLHGRFTSLDVLSHKQAFKDRDPLF